MLQKHLQLFCICLQWTLLVDAIEILKVGHQKEGVCASKYKEMGKITKTDFDSTMCPKNSDILLAENSLFMDTGISISDEGSHAGEKEQYLNASASKTSNVSFNISINFLY
ncbi:hypothetical protein TNCV_1035801 [Trichonephila clavipes]|nr:hypothetical protein TNCV_1035801 [Trichonephila clavipes]